MGVSTLRTISPPLPSSIPWATGRFYDMHNSINATSTITIGAAVYLVLFYVPNQVTLATIGIEVTGAATAGTNMRLALYTMDSHGWPDDLVDDFGQAAVDSTGFKSLSPNLNIIPGWYWAAIAQQAAAANATFRSNGGNVIRTIASATLATPNNNQSNGITMTGIGSQFASVGFPSQVLHMGDGANTVNAGSNANLPRILMGV